MNIYHLLVVLAISILIGGIAWILFSIFPPTKEYRNPLAFLIALLVFLIEIGVVK